MTIRLFLVLIMLMTLSACAVSYKEFGFSSNGRGFAQKTIYSSFDEKSNSHLFSSCSYNATTHFGPFFIYPTPFIPQFPDWSLEREIATRSLQFYTVTDRLSDAGSLSAITEDSGKVLKSLSVNVEGFSGCNELDKLSFDEFELSSKPSNTEAIKRLCSNLDLGEKHIKYLTTFSYTEKCGEIKSANVKILNGKKIVFDELLHEYTFWGSR